MCTEKEKQEMIEVLFDNPLYHRSSHWTTQLYYILKAFKNKKSVKEFKNNLRTFTKKSKDGNINEISLESLFCSFGTRALKGLHLTFISCTEDFRDCKFCTKLDEIMGDILKLYRALIGGDIKHG